MEPTDKPELELPSAPQSRRFRFSMATAMLLVIPAASASALFAKLYQHIPAGGGAFLKIDAPLLFVVSIILTAIALGSLKGHSAVQLMGQVTLACGGYIGLLSMNEAHLSRPLLYWFQGSFALLVTLPLVVRRYAKREFPRGPRLKAWKNWCEAVFFSFLTMLLVLVGLGLQFLAAYLSDILKF